MSSASALFTFSDGPAVRSLVGSLFNPDAPSSSRHRWYAPDCRRLRIQSLRSYFTAPTRPAAVWTPRPPSIVLISGVSSEGPVAHVYILPTQRATRAATSATLLLGVLSPDSPSSGSTPAAPSVILTSTNINLVQSFERYSHTGWAREQSAEPLCDAASLVRPPWKSLGSTGQPPLTCSVLKTPPVVRSTLFTGKRAPLHERRCNYPSCAQIHAPSPGLFRNARREYGSAS